MGKMIMAIVLASELIIVGIFVLFSAFHHCEKGEPERILFCGLGVFTLSISVVVAIGIMNC